MRPHIGTDRRRRGRDRPEAALIPEIHKRGSKVGGLLSYLFGPGKREEHRNPHLVAVWDGAGNLAALQPPCSDGGKHSLKRLIQLLEQPVRAALRPPPLTVWHCSVRNHHTDRILSDQQWQHIAAEIVAGVGLAPHGDPDAVRWIAVRHADDHIHIVATLVRQDGRTAWAWNDKPKAQAAARDLEQRYGLYRVGPVDHTSHHRPGMAEQNKTRRQGRPEIPRDRLRREVRAAAAAVADETEFFRTLQTAGVLVRLRNSTINPDEVTGYAVGLPDHHTAAGDTVWYGGGRLAPDLTLPQLRHRWHAVHGTAAAAKRPRTRVNQRVHAFRQAAAATQSAAEQLSHGEADLHDDDTSGIASAAADVLTSTARAFEGRRRGRLTDAAETFDRAAREPHRRLPRHSRQAGDLRAMSRLIAVVGRLTGDHDTAAALQLLLQMSMLADNLADLRDAQRRLHQARAARQVAEQLRTIAASSTHGAIVYRPEGPAMSSQPARDRKSAGRST
jgi:hypothetical protein